MNLITELERKYIAICNTTVDPKLQELIKRDYERMDLKRKELKRKQYLESKNENKI